MIQLRMLGTCQEPIIPLTLQRVARSKRKYFPRVLYDMLQEQDNYNSGVITWLQDSAGFTTHNKMEFKVVLLQKHFRGIKFRLF